MQCKPIAAGILPNFNWMAIQLATSQLRHKAKRKKVNWITKPSQEHVLFVCLALVSTGKDLGPGLTNNQKCQKASGNKSQINT